MTSGKIADLAVDTLKIKDNAVTVPVATTLLTEISKTTTKQPSNFDGGVSALIDSSSYFGDILSLTINRSGGKCRIEGSVWIENVVATGYTSAGGIISSSEQFVGLLVYRNGSLMSWARVPTSYKDTNQVREHSGIAMLPIIIDDVATGVTTYSIRIGVSINRSNAGIQMGVFSGPAKVSGATLAVMEIKK